MSEEYKPETALGGLVLYGIPNCDTVRKARSWLNEHEIGFDFHDFKKLGVPKHVVKAWLTKVKWQQLINCKGTTWRALTQEQKQPLIDSMQTDHANAAIQNVVMGLTEQFPSLIKRPVLDGSGILHIGFSCDQYERLLIKTPKSD